MTAERNSIYLVYAEVDCPGGIVPVAAFLNKGAAELFVGRCEAHRATKPSFVSKLNHESSCECKKCDREYSRQQAAMNRWNAAHPAAGFKENAGYYDGYAVSAIPMGEEG